MTKKKVYLESTEVPAERTANQIQGKLVEAGARQVLTEYEKGEITGLHFILDVDGKHIPFKMPVKTETIFKLLQQRRRSSSWRFREKDQIQAKRIAWRQLLRWVEIQLAMVDTGMSEAAEVFYPYMEVAPGKTMYQMAIETHFRAALPPAPSAVEVMPP